MQIVIAHYGPGELDNEQAAESVTIAHLTQHPDVNATATWEVPTWDQILEAIHDPFLTQPQELGNMQAAE